MKNKRYLQLVELVFDKMKELLVSKDILAFLIKNIVHFSFDKELATEKELQSMLDEAISSYKKD